MISLLDSMKTKCTMIDTSHISDGEGGFIVEYVDGASIDAAITLDTSTQARIGAAQGVKNLYTVTVSKNVPLKYGDILRREEDKKLFAITSDGSDKKTPDVASLDMRQVSAEEWRIPSDE